MIHETAIVSASAKIGAGVSIGAFSIIHDSVVLEENCEIDSFCELGHPTPLADGEPLLIGRGARIRSYTCLYAGSRFGPGLVTGHHVTARDGNVAGEGLQIGSYSDLQGRSRFGDYVRMQTGVFVGRTSVVGSYVWLFPFVKLLNDPHPPSEVLLGPTVEDFAALGGGSVILPGVRVGRDSLVGAGSVVKDDVAPGALVAGNPARFIRSASSIVLRDGSQAPAYPWRRHFHRGYPPDVVKEWLDEELP